MPSRKRELLARGMYWSGLTTLLERLPARNTLLVLNYHRIGNANEDLFDPGVFSATADELDEQVGYLTRRHSVVTLDEALDFIEGTEKSRTRRCRVLITFDDGYLDNYQLAFPILRSHGVQGVFFLATSLVGSTTVPWWDHIAYLVKTAKRRRFSLSYPDALDIDLDSHGVAASIRSVLALYKRPANTDPDRFLTDLTDLTQAEDLPRTQRRFLDYEEARQMIARGMAIGSHTHSHHVLSQLPGSQQRAELERSRTEIRENLGIDADSLAYPVGARTSFSEDTQAIARDCGYRAAFSFFGGLNLPGQTPKYDVKRYSVDDQSAIRFQAKMAMCRAQGKYWP